MKKDYFPARPTPPFSNGRRRRWSVCLWWFVASVLLAGVSVAIPPRVDARGGDAERFGADPGSKYWVYFSDRGERNVEDMARMLGAVHLSPRSLERRRAVGLSRPVDAHDVPPARDYIDALRAHGLRVLRTSRYLNAASVRARAVDIEWIRRLEFVKRVERVRTYRRRRAPLRPVPTDGTGSAGSPQRGVSAESYGLSQAQLEQINVPPLHNDGFHGEGVVIAILDTGFNRGHEALDHLDVLAERDFIFNDPNTRNEAGQDSLNQHNHGTYTLSAMAGYQPGQLIGPAYAATIVLAKTERMFEEVHGEEDDYVAALEWADSLGARVVSSSLGYFTFDPGQGDYTPADLDGNTAVTTIAADIAASKGIVVVTAAGNENGSSWNTIITPADADSVVTVGAVDDAGVIASFSSRGPTADGRFKPDVVARGVGTRCAMPWDSLGYTSVSGTSLSTPLVAGACALILQRNPGWGPVEVLTALHDKASMSGTPDNTYGWGIVDAYQTAVGGATGIIGSVSLDVERRGRDVFGSVVNAGSSMVLIDVQRRRLESGGAWTEPADVVLGVVLPGLSSGQFVDVLPASGGAYQYRLALSDDASRVSLWATLSMPVPLALSQNAPNPFVAGTGAETTISFMIQGAPALPGSRSPLGAYADVALEIFDVAGRRVVSLPGGLLAPGGYTRRWDGMRADGTLAASGVYFYRLRANGAEVTRKLVLIRR